MLVLVRHGLAGSKAAWRPRDERERPLSPLGRQQAQGVARLVGPWGPTRIISSPAVRCLQTVHPLALRSGLEVGVVDYLGAARTRTAELARRVAAEPGEVVVMATHGETIARLLRHWKRSGAVDLPMKRKQIAKTTTEKGGLWVVVDRQSHYVPPLLVDEIPDEAEDPSPMTADLLPA